MNKFRRVGQLLAATTATSLVLSGTAVAGAQENTVEVSISNFTDFHGYLEQSLDDDEEEGTPATGNSQMGAALLASLMDYVAGDDDVTFKTTSGDNVGGSAFVSSISNDKYTLEALNEMGIDASAVGNHEFDQGIDDLTERIVPESNYPILGANVIDTATGEPALPASQVVEKDGVRVAFIGTVTTQTPNKVSPAGVAGLEFIDPVEAANNEATRITEADEADVVIVLQHEDTTAVNGFNEHVDAAFGGDSHLRHEEADDNGTLTAQAHEYGKVLNEYEFEFNTETGEIVEGSESITQYDYTSEGVAELTPDAEVAETVAAAVAESDTLGNEVITEIENTYYRGSNPGEEPGSNRGTESTANNMLAEANRWAMNDFLGGDTIDLGLMNAGGVRADLEAGEVTVKDAQTQTPFGNNLAYATLSGEAIINALENQWTEGTDNSRPRLSLGVSNNVSYTYDPNAAKGERILEVLIDGEPIDPAADYTVATATFLFEGGDGFINPDDVEGLTDVGYLDVTAYSDYLESEGAPVMRVGQAEYGISTEDDIVAGETISLDLSSLNYSTEGEPMAENVTVTVGEQSQTVAIDNTTTEADAGFGEQGRATVEIVVPEGVSDLAGLAAAIEISTDVEQAETPEDEWQLNINSSVDDFGFDLGSSNAIIGGIVAVIAAIAAIIGISNFL